MRPIEYYDAVYERGIEDDVRNRTLYLRGMFMGTGGPEMLKRMIANGHFFEATEPGDTVADAERNYVVRMMDDLGMLDEENLTAIVEFMLSLPLPARERRK